MQSQLNEFKFQNSPVGTFGGIPEPDMNPRIDHSFHETSHNRDLIMSGGASSQYLNQSNLSGSEQPIYKEVSLKFSNKFAATASDS